jgi:hypothetical protein
MNEHDLEYLREKLALLGEPELPPALSAAALFQRMEEGSLSLPEEDPLEETAAAGEEPAGESPSQGGKVISWKKVLRRGIPLAACLALVLMVYQGREVGLAKNFGAANQPAPAAHAPEAAYDEDKESSGEQKSLLRSSKTEDAPAEGEEGQRPSALMASSASSAPVSPEPDAGSDTAKQEKDAGQEPENAPTLNESDEEKLLHPDQDLNPDIGWGEADEEWERRTSSLQAQALETASQYAPREGLTPVFRGSSEEADSKKIEFFIIYCDQEGREVAANQFCFVLADETDPANPRLELVSVQEWQQP